MSNKTAFTVQNLFSIATRNQCMTNLKKMRMPQRSGKVPSVKAAVLVPFCKVNDTPSLLYTVRSDKLRTNSGQISFPGGKTDLNETPIETALRETHEEIGLAPDKVDVWGDGPAFPGRDNKMLITPVVGSVMDLTQDDLDINPKEVAEVFTVPIETLCDSKNQFHTQFSNGFILPVFVANEYKIWGITAYVTHAFLSSLMPKETYKNEWMKKKIVIKEQIFEN